MPTPIRDLECFVFDMDGTINLGETLIPGALELIQSLQARRIKFFFFTNNSSKAPDDSLFEDAFPLSEGVFGRHTRAGSAVCQGGDPAFAG